MLHIIKDCCDELSPRNFAEAGCAVCGQLKRLKSLSPLKSIKRLLHVLEAPGITRLERKTSKDLVSEYKGPVLDYDATIGNEKKLMVCSDCRENIHKGRVPHFALAKGFWIGTVLKELSDLSWVERMLIARVRHNSCFVRVASGHRQMVAHAVAFESPMQKIYDTLPPPIQELDEVLAVMFTGPCAPKDNDFKRLKALLVQ